MAPVTEILPELPFEFWRPTKETLHRFVQVVGKVALAKGVRRNHWWHMTYRLTPHGWTTVPLGTAGQGPVFALSFDFSDHVLRVAADDGAEVDFPLLDQSVASFHRETMRALRAIGVEPGELEKATPYELPDKARPFAEDTEHDDYNPVLAERAFRVYSQVGRILEEFSARFSGKISPVQVYWHSFDVAVARFSDRHIAMGAGVNPVNREAYSRELISAGFWYGDDSVPEPTFYSYTAPEPEGLADEPLSPAAASWKPSGSGHTAMLSYDEVRKGDDPVGTALAFYESAYAAGAKRAGWDVEQLSCWDGVTDPVLREASRQ